MRDCVIGLVPDLIGGFSQKSGIYWFSRALINSIDQLDSPAKFVVFIPRCQLVDFSHLSPRFKIVPVPQFFSTDLRNSFWHLFILPLLAVYYRVQVLHLFAGNRRLSLFSPRRTLVTVHDVYHYNRPKLYGIYRFIYFRILICGLLRRQVNLHAVSDATAADLQRFLDIPSASITVIRNGFDGPRFRLPAQQLEVDLSGIIPIGPYFLYVSSYDHPRKNHIALIKAYESVVSASHNPPDLVLVGPDFASSEVIHDAISASSVSKRIHSLGFVSNQQLGLLYKRAFAFVHPSQCEGFGYPLIEAMHFGLPVVCSSIPAFKEVAGDAPVYFDACNVSDIAAKLLLVINDESLRKRCASLSVSAAYAGSHHSSASLIFSLYMQIYKRC